MIQWCDRARWVIGIIIWDSSHVKGKKGLPPDMSRWLGDFGFAGQYNTEMSRLFAQLRYPRVGESPE